MKSKQYRKGSVVRGVPGRVSHGWRGEVVEVQEKGVVVEWDGRRNHEDAKVRKSPRLFMLFEHVQPFDNPL